MGDCVSVSVTKIIKAELAGAKQNVMMPTKVYPPDNPVLVRRPKAMSELLMVMMRNLVCAGGHISIVASDQTIRVVASDHSTRNLKIIIIITMMMRGRG